MVTIFFLRKKWGNLPASGDRNMYGNTIAAATQLTIIVLYWGSTHFAATKHTRVLSIWSFITPKMLVRYSEKNCRILFICFNGLESKDERVKSKVSTNQL